MCRAQPVTSDVFHCVHETLTFVKVVFKMQKTRNFETMIAQSLRVMSERHLISWTHLTSLAEYGSSPFQDGGNEIIFTQTQRPLIIGQTKSTTPTQRIFSGTTTLILQSYKR